MYDEPWSVITDRRLSAFEDLKKICEQIVRGFDPEHDRYHLSIDSKSGGCTIEVGLMRDILEKLSD